MIRVACMGDSITAGQHLDHGVAAWPAHLPGVTAYAKGVPGDTTRLGLERFPRDVQALEPDIVIIQFGHNDANRWQTDRGLPRVSLDGFVANLDEMIARCQAFSAAVILCTLTPSYRSPLHAADCRWYDAALRNLASRRPVRLADVSGLDESHMLDGLHLNGEGQRAYAAIVAGLLP